MFKHHNESEQNQSFFKDELIRNKPEDDIIFDEENNEETAEEYNEELFKWLSIAILVVWLASIIYL